MHPRPHSKSSPAKRDTTRVLTPHLNHVSAPSDDVFHTGLLTPHASQNTVEMDAAKSLISPPPEGNAQAGTSRQHVCSTFQSDFGHKNLGLTFSTSQSRWSRAGSEPTSTLRRVSNTGSSSKRKRSAFPSHSLQDPRGMIEASPNPKSRKQTRTGSDTGESVSLDARGPPVDSSGNHQRNTLKLFTGLPFGGSSAKVMPPLQRVSTRIFFDVLVLPLLALQSLSAVPPFSVHLMREMSRQIIYPRSLHITVNTCLHEPGLPRPFLFTNLQPRSSHPRAR